MFQSITKTTAVIVCSTILATLTVNAANMYENFSSSMLAGLFSIFPKENVGSLCPDNMVIVNQAIVPFCIDVYEVSANEKCLYKSPTNEDETMYNLIDFDCEPVSEPNSIPWRNVTQTQATDACSRIGKRLPTANEWYKASLGTNNKNSNWDEDDCNVANNRTEGVSETGGGMRCVSDAGAYDMIGNVWEWVEETVKNGEWNGIKLPASGFVTGVDINGMAYKTKNSKDSNFNNDKIWVDEGIVAGMMRGGYYNSQGQAGMYATYAASAPTFSGEAVGFRCVVTANNQ